MRGKVLVVLGLVALSVLCGFTGYTYGVPATMGICSTDTTTTCAFTCKQVAGQNLWIASISTTQVPYCKGTTPACDGASQLFPCNILKYTKANCEGNANNGINYSNACTLSP